MDPWATGPVVVIKPLPSPWLGLGGDGCFDCLSPTRVSGPFLSKWSSFPSFFHLDAPLLTTLDADVEAPSFSFCMRAIDNALTKALCLLASISMKGKMQLLEEETLI